MVNGKSREYWESQLLKISRALPDKVTESLKLSYEALDREGQQMFLDVACFFIGKEKNLVVALWDGSGWSGQLGFETLVDKCLVGVDEDGFIDMHDHFRDLGREIAREVSPSRIWNEEQISIQGGTAQIRGIVVGLSWQQFSVMHYMEEIIERPSSPALQLLAVRGNDFRKEFAALSRDLVWLRWCDFKGTNLPSWLSPANLRVLELLNAKSLEELWPDNVQLTQLIIDLSGRTFFHGLPRSIGHLRHLKKIIVNGSGMRRLPEEFRHLGSLEILKLSHSPHLEDLPDLTTLVSLRELCLRYTGLRGLPDSIGQLTKLETLVIGSVNLTSLPESVGELPCLTSLEIDNCKMLRYLPQTFERLHNLRSLKIMRTPVLEYGLVMDSPSECNIKNLECLTLVGTRVGQISISHACCPCLTTLCLSYNIHLKAIDCLPESIREILVQGCEELQRIPDPLNIENLVVIDCPRLEQFPIFEDKF